jgi:hypothetical protein
LSSQTSALYAQAVDDIRKTLAGLKGPQAARMLTDAERLHEEFEAWQTAPPGPSERRAAINRLFALYREVLEHAVKK